VTTAIALPLGRLSPARPQRLAGVRGAIELFILDRRADKKTTVRATHQARTRPRRSRRSASHTSWRRRRAARSCPTKTVTLGPVLCPNGKPSAAGDAWARSYTPPPEILRLGAGATVAEVKTAVCADINQSHVTWAVEGSFYTLARAERNWRFTFDYNAFRTSGG
jgi:hypothetical protein